jgi:hypothetical protein
MDADDSSFLHMTGLNREAFRALLEKNFDLDAIVRNRPCGRPRSLNPDGYLGLLLFYLGSMMTSKHLCLIFGITPSVCSRAINFMLSRVVRNLWVHLMARIQFPKNKKMAEFAAMVQRREPLVDDVIGFMDGVSFTTQSTDEHLEQNAFYCGYNCDTTWLQIHTFFSLLLLVTLCHS